jgi:Flavin containing amine oxidoreductase
MWPSSSPKWQARTSSITRSQPRTRSYCCRRCVNGGALDDKYAYKAEELSSDRRGYQRDPGGGLMYEAVPSEPLPFAEILRSRVWYRLALGQIYEFQSTIFQPVGGMDMIARGFAREIGSLIRYNAKVTAIKQGDKHVTVTYVDARTGGAPMTAAADWCLCTIPLSVLDQIDLSVGAPMMNAINAVPYGAAAKIGLLQAPLLGGGRADLWRHHLYGPADLADRLSEHELWQPGARASCSAPTCSTPRMRTSSRHCRRRTA